MEEDILCYPLIYYTEDMLADFSGALTTEDRASIEKKIEALKTKNLTGSYEETVDAFNALGNLLDDFPLLNLMSQISKAGELCEIHDPRKAPTFFNALSTIMEAADKESFELLSKTLDKVMPQAREVIARYDSQAGTVQTGVVR